MPTQDVATETAQAAIKGTQWASIAGHIAERRIEYLLGSLIAYQLGLLDQFVTYGSQCLA